MTSNAVSPRKRERGNGRQLAPEQAAVAAMVAEARQRGPGADRTERAAEGCLVHGRDDKVIPLSSSQHLAQQIPGARLEAIPECGHWVDREDDEFCPLVDEFCPLVLEILGHACGPGRRSRPSALRSEAGSRLVNRGGGA